MLKGTLQRDADLAKEGLQAAERRAEAAEHQTATLHSSLAAAEDRQRMAEGQAEVRPGLGDSPPMPLPFLVRKGND